jgi:hypothetical protein
MVALLYVFFSAISIYYYSVWVINNIMEVIK